jgi:glycosyltransferase involved in cell wall biosynthesis
MTGDPLVSIRCLVYNHEPYLRQCLDGFVMQQTTFPFEAIIHDDASTDGSAAIIREYAEKYPDIIKPIYETENQYSKHDGSLGRNIRTVADPNAKYIATCEGDDFWTDPLKLQKQVDVLEKHPDVTIVFCKVNTVTKEGNPLDWTIPSVETTIPIGKLTLDDYMNEEYYNFRWTFHASTFCFRSGINELHHQLGKSVYKRFPFGDQTIILSCLFQGKGYYIPDITGSYRVASGGYFSNVNKSIDNRIKFYERCIKAHEDLDDYTEGRYSKAIKRRKDLSTFNILKMKYENHLMTPWQRIKFPLYTLWKVRRSFSSFKSSFTEFLRCIAPSCFTLYEKMRH